MGKSRWGNEDEDDLEFGENTDPGFGAEEAPEVETREAVEADVAVREQPRDAEYDAYYDEPVPKGSGGRFVIREDGKRYRRRPE